ncbi:MAG: PTS sugar transporter subunit IIA [Spirochaetaceae bacterium]|jgi:PTS system fructose-specific IIC component/PTS system nitrogen regulatory IIA component|nr:PTS sugar transporter subunit IIA [Spirochaetaceae bacterium]
MFLKDVYRPEFIKVNLEAEDKEEAFEELVDHFCGVSGIKNRQPLLKAIQEREAKMSTGIKKGIAIPHGKTNTVDRVCGVLGISKKGIDYDALDGNPVHLLFLILAPEKDSETHLRLLKRLATLLDDPQFYTELALQPGAQDAYEIIKKYEEMLVAGSI